MVSTLDFESSDPSSNLGGTLTWLRGATVARLTPDQKAACSNHVGVSHSFLLLLEAIPDNFCKIISCLQWGLNSWPLVYKTNALPLSYRGIGGSLRKIVTLSGEIWPWPHVVLPPRFCCSLHQWLNGLGVWFSLWVREVPGSNPGWAQLFFHHLSAKGWFAIKMLGDTRIWTMGLSDCSRLLYHWAISPADDVEYFHKVDNIGCSR